MQTDKEADVMNVIGAFCEYSNDLKNSKICHNGNNQSAGDGKKTYLKNITSTTYCAQNG